MKLTTTLAVAILVPAFAAATAAADPHGPAFGANRYRAAIHDVSSSPDVDDYVADLLAGEKLTVSVTVGKGSALIPRLTLVDPDGDEIVPAGASVKKGGKSVSLKHYLVPATGRWAVRIAGEGGSQGAYDVSFSVSPAPQLVVKKAQTALGPDEVVEFLALDGSVVDVKVTWKDRTHPMTFGRLEDPRSFDVAGVKTVTTPTSVTIKGLAVRGGSGVYKLHLGHPNGTTIYGISVRAKPQGRPAGRKPVALSDDEPFLDPVAAPIRGIYGRNVTLSGGNFVAGRPPLVLFGSQYATVVVMPDLRTLDVSPPGSPDGSLVPVAVIGADGQAMVRERYFYYVPAPVISDLEDVGGKSKRIGPAAGGEQVVLVGSNFGAGQAVRFGAKDAVGLTLVSSTRFQFTIPASTGKSFVYVVDEFGRSVHSSFEYTYLQAPTIAAAAATGGVLVDSTHVAMQGGTVVTVTGTNLDVADTVTLGGVTCLVTSATGTTLNFTSPALAVGNVNLTVTDAIGQSALLTKALRVAGLDDATLARAPSLTAEDSFTAVRAASGDLDGDGRVNDVVIVSDTVSPGTRKEFTRVLLGNSGALVDVTATKMPAARSDPAGVDEWKASALALGDVDDNGTLDLLIGGARIAATGGDSLEARLFTNDGTGSMTLSPDSPIVRTAPWTCTDSYYYSTYDLFTPASPGTSRTTAIATGDLDGDGYPEIVVGSDAARSGLLHVPLSNVAFYGDSAVSYDTAAVFNSAGTAVDAPSLRIFRNDRGSGGGFTDVTFFRLPRSEVSGGTEPAYVARDLAIGDVNGDGSPDIVVTWYDPTRTTPYGLTNLGTDGARLATRILLNDGSGGFTDATDTWMPVARGTEYWQADRLVLKDLDGDADLDLMLLSSVSIDSWTGTTTHTSPALRILRNGGQGVGFEEYTTSALGSVPRTGTQDDDLRGSSVAVVDFDKDGIFDLVVGTTSAPLTTSGGAAPCTRVFRGLGNLRFADVTALLPAVSAESGEADEVLRADLAGAGKFSLVLVTALRPAASTSHALLRVLDWIP